AWVNDVQVANYTNIPLSNDPVTMGTQRWFTDFLLSSYWNSVCNVTPTCQNDGTQCQDPINAHPLMQRLVDRVVISRARIGCSGSSGTQSATQSASPPAPPGQVQAR